ncbi:hypothetical protein ILYODFUR_026273 [Ilyodon furcidens]|uniref:Uncharacterized protein n=1 Tax=Ilyodon furcidens TaxID=33524 RepID=A0ABV0TMZ4_9TELE
MFSVALILLLTAGSCVHCIDLIQPDSKIVQPGQSLTITCRPSGYSLTDGSYATAAARQFDAKLTDRDYSETVKKWLRYAPERERGIPRNQSHPKPSQVNQS